MDMTLPRELDDLTPAWLMDALHQGGALTRGRVVSVDATRIAEGLSLLSRLGRLVVGYEGANDGAPRSVIVKYPTDLPQTRKVVDAYRFYKRECDFYRSMARKTPLRVPALYYEHFDGGGDFVLLIEDLAPARTGDQIIGNSAEDARAAVLSLAEHHARFWNQTSEMAFLVDVDDSTVCAVLESLYAAACRKTIEAFSEHFTPELERIAVALGSRTTKLLQNHHDYPLTVVHGDFRADNLFYGLPGSAVAVVDWQIAMRAHGPYDIALHMTQSVRTEVRRDLERPLLREYHEKLVAYGVKDYSFDDLWEFYRETALFVLVYPITACGNLDLTHPRTRALGEVFLTRALSAITDLAAGEKLPV